MQEAKELMDYLISQMKFSPLQASLQIQVSLLLYTQNNLS